MNAIARQLRDATAVTPEPLPLVAEALPASPFPLAALGPMMEGVARAIMARAFVPPQTAVQSLLSAASLALQPHFNVQLPTGQVRPVSLFLVTIAKSGARKSTSDDRALEEVAAFQQELDERHRAESAGEAAARTAWDIAKAETVRDNKKGGAAALARALEDLGPRPNEAAKPVLIARVGTTQGLLKFFDVSRPSLGLMSDEGGTWLGGYGMTEDNKLNTIATLSDLWDGKPIQRMTSGEGMTVLYNRRLTFHLMLQPVLAGRLLGDAEAKGQGFLSRLLVTQPDSLAGTRIVNPAQLHDPAADAALAAYANRLGRILRVALPQDPDTGALRPRALPMSEEASLMWWAFYNQLERRVGPGGDLEDVDGFVGKLPEQAARIAAVLATFEHGLAVQQLDTTHLADGIRVAEFYLSEAQRLFGAPTVDPAIADAQRLSDWMRDTWPENLICVRAIQQKAPPPIRRLGADRIRQLMETLTRHEHVGPRLPNGGTVSGAHAREAWRVHWPRPSHD